MNDEYIYKELYEAAQEDTKDANNAFIRYFDKQAKEDLGDRYYDYKDFVVVQELKSIISDLENPDWDKFETPDNKVTDIASMYRVLKYFLTHGDYQKFVEERRDAKTKERD